MNAGGTYALVLDAAPVKTSLMIGSLRAALNEAIPCLLLLSSASDVSSNHALSLWGADLAQATQKETLRVFVHESEFKSNLFRFGINRFIQDLELLKPQNKSYIWLDHAEELFALQDMQFATKQLKILRSWLQAREITAIFVFAKLNTTETHDIHLLSEDLSGLCRIAGGAKGLEAKFLHWQSPDGAISHRNYSLAETATGFYRATRSSQAPGGVEGGAVGADGQASRDNPALFINLDPSVQASLDSTETDWQFLDSPLSLLHAVRGSVTPTVVLRFGQDTSIKQLAETVHTLRTVVGRGAKIIIHEDEFSLRFNYESLLLRLGANFIMHRDVPVWRLSRVIDSLEGTQFDRAVDVDFGALMSSAFPSQRSGLVSVDDLVFEIESILRKTKLNNVPIAFFIGIFATARDAQDVLNTFDMTREGDLFAIEDQIIYIFLSACPPSHVLETIERKLKGSLSTTFSTTSTSTQTTDIEQQLKGLKLHLGIESREPARATAEPDFAYTQEARPPLKPDGIVSRSPFSFEPVGATTLPTSSMPRRSEPRFSEPAPRRAPPAQVVDTTRPVDSSSQEIPSRAKPLVFTKIRSTSDRQTE
jgi:cellulose biosynthesis protein BcsE